jgi:hypothetical protein
VPIADFYPADGFSPASDGFPPSLSPLRLHRLAKISPLARFFLLHRQKKEPKENANPIPLESPLKINSLRRWGNSRGATVAALKHSPA